MVLHVCCMCTYITVCVRHCVYVHVCVRESGRLIARPSPAYYYFEFYCHGSRVTHKCMATVVMWLMFKNTLCCLMLRIMLGKLARNLN
jgi:hypothetical protein